MFCEDCWSAILRQFSEMNLFGRIDRNTSLMNLHLLA